MNDYLDKRREDILGQELLTDIDGNGSLCRTHNLGGCLWLTQVLHLHI